jgi:3,4-dihydroxy-9,10-secoandrosta-1,3,5(10)-triene-9,17-dione 4,5-dioxygenase
VEEWRAFGADVLGLMPVPGEDGSLGFRIDVHPPRLVIEPAAEKRVQAVGFQVRDGRELADLVEAVEKTGIEVTDGTPAEADRRRVTGFVRFQEPGGTPIELYHGPIRDHVPLATPLVSGFVTGDMGMGHVVISSADFAASHELFTRVLGLGERNYMNSKGRDLWFLSPNPRHHTLGLLALDGPARLFHFMFQVSSIDDVGLALDRIEQTQTRLMLTLGRHTNDEMVSFYVYSPDGYAVEFGYGAPRCDDTPTYAITKASYWGHRYVGD